MDTHTLTLWSGRAGPGSCAIEPRGASMS